MPVDLDLIAGQFPVLRGEAGEADPTNVADLDSGEQLGRGGHRVLPEFAGREEGERGAAAGGQLAAGRGLLRHGAERDGGRLRSAGHEPEREAEAQVEGDRFLKVVPRAEVKLDGQ